MKRISTFILGLALSAFAAATTLNPVQLLNPAGSTAGQAVISNGATSAPTWQAVPLTGLATQGANTVLGNGTASTAAPTALTVPSCSASTNALLWTSGTGFSCNSGINAATLGGATFASPGAIGGTAASAGTFTTLTSSNAALSGGAINGTPIGATTASTGRFTTLAATSTITPSSTAGIVGTTTNDSANAGSFGEYLSNTTTGTNLASGAQVNATSLPLTAGDWGVSCMAQFNPTGGATPTTLQSGISTTSATLGAFGTKNILQASFTASSTQGLPTPVVRVSLASSATAYCVVQLNFTGGTATVDGIITARRIR